MTMKKTLIRLFLSLFLAAGCSAESRIKEYSYTNKIYTWGSSEYQVYKTKSGREYIIILNDRETKFIRYYLN